MLLQPLNWSASVPDPTAEDIDEIWDCHLDRCSIAYIATNKVDGLSRRAIAKVLAGPVPERFKDDPRLLPYRFLWVSVIGAPVLADGSDAAFVFLKLPRKMTEADFRKACTKLKRVLAEARPGATLGMAVEEIESGIVLKYMREKGYLGWDLAEDGTLSVLAIEAIEPDSALAERPPGP
jgi:hypothetical protein